MSHQLQFQITKKSANDILIEKLIEVGDRVFFDYDQSRFKMKVLKL